MLRNLKHLVAIIENLINDKKSGKPQKTKKYGRNALGFCQQVARQC